MLILHKDLNIKYNLRKNKRSKTLSISISTDKKITVTTPFRLPQYYIDTFINQKGDWINKVLDKLNTSNTFALKGPSSEYKQLKSQAYKIIKSRIEIFNQFYNFEYKSISIRNQSSRWGSCTSNKTLNFNYKVAFLPPELRDYIIIHELCHLKEMNHSDKFWEQVAKTEPDYKTLRKRLRERNFELNTIY